MHPRVSQRGDDITFISWNIRGLGRCRRRMAGSTTLSHFLAHFFIRLSFLLPYAVAFQLPAAQTQQQQQQQQHYSGPSSLF